MLGDAALTRRALVVASLTAGGLSFLPGVNGWARATGSSRAPIAFDVYRNGQRIGAHRVEFEGEDAALKVRTTAEFLVKFGPIPVFRYNFQSHETWRDGKFSALESQAQTNGRRDQVHAVCDGSCVTIQTAHGPTHTAPADALPLSHWNSQALRNPLFNPQTGSMLKERVTHQAAETLRLPDSRSIQTTKFTLTGETEITDWYDPSGAWVALRGRIKDGSYLDYRLTA